ncbi:hypothetical protein Brsp06_04970 [Brucella sp. NBRC 13694]|jgi:hypothetical protein|uniref:hypothetical protein n=1 Tax=Brucella/Ochrobactrum group TaxID=2826938 RepID=UPI000F67D870|nr:MULTISPECIES: hypothetical protein [Brucella/Ochrobactrum group]MCR5943617.1 hypothetical protein [Ochrobactrum sp. XJ1]RRY15779.1 hypothetical protein EGJ57_23835 [Brucella anthropi]
MQQSAKAVELKHHKFFVWPYFWRWAGVAAFLLSFPISLISPLWISWENQILENMQVFVLAVGAAFCIRLVLRSSSMHRLFWLSILPLWCILIAREVSWGAVFLEPIAASELGPQFSSSQLSYYPARTPLVFLIIIASCVGLYFSKPWHSLCILLQSRKLPFFDFLGFFVSMIASAAAEHHLGLSLNWWSGHAQVIEETMELAAYLFLVSGQIVLWRGACSNTPVAPQAGI